MSINKGTMIKLKKQTAAAMAEMSCKRIVDEALDLRWYRLRCMVTDVVSDPMTFDEAMKRPDIAAYELVRERERLC